MKKTGRGSAGNSCILNGLAEHDKIESESVPEVALYLTTKALQRRNPKITQRDVEGFIVVSRTFRQGGVDIPAEVEAGINQAAPAADRLIRDLTAGNMPVPPSVNDELTSVAMEEEEN